MNKLYCDVLISGAGIIGACLAIRLAQHGIKVIIIDNKYPVPIEKNMQPHIRVAAINYASIEFLKTINIWNQLTSDFCCLYHRLEVWEWPLSKVTFQSTSLNLSVMGCIIENNRLQSILWSNFFNFKTIKLYCPAMLISMKYNGLHWTCILNNNITIISYLLVGADGANSQIRNKLGIGVFSRKYNQNCMLLSIKTEKCTYGTIWQMFTPNGPIGFLPLYNNWGSLMWYDTPGNINIFKKLPIVFLEKKIENSFQEKLGRVKLKNIAIVPLMNQNAYNYVISGGVLVGDAAHTIHPLVGQGINLGLRDVVCLSNLLVNSRIFDDCSNLSEVLVTYQKNRKRDTFLIQTSVNYLYDIFHNNLLPLKIIRNIIFITIEHCPYLKKKILRYAVGLKI